MSIFAASFKSNKQVRGLFAFIIGLMLPLAAMAQSYSVSGTVKEKATGKAVDFATIALLNSEQWAVVDGKGNFEIKNVPAGDNKISVSCLGFVTVDKELNVNGNIEGLVFELEEDNLRLESAVVTAKDNTNSATTSRTIDKAALEHIQVTNVASVTGLLPGGSTSTGSLTSLQTISLRGGGSFNTSIAVWDKPEDTLKAIEEEDLKWGQIINCQRIPGELYGIEGIPTMILFGPDGTILERGGNLRGANMEATIAKYLNK